MYHVVFSFLHLGLIWSEVKQLWDIGLHEYVNDMWNVIDFVTNSLYVATVALRVVSYFQVSERIPRELGYKRHDTTGKEAPSMYSQH